MKKTFIGFCAATLLLAVVVYSQSGGASDKLTLTVSFPKDRVIMLEPIPIRLTLENRTYSALRQSTVLDLERVKFAIEKPDGKIVKPERLTNTLSSVYGGTGDVQAGARKEIKEILQYELLKWFDQPGQYRIKATLPNGDSSIESDWAVIAVEEPTGNDAAAFEFVRTKVVTESGVILSARPEIKEEMLEKFPDSPYADYVRYSLARWYENRDKAKSIELYSRLKTNPNFVYANEVKGKLESLQSKKEE